MQDWEQAIAWGDYARVEPGEYNAYCRWVKVYRDRGLKRWTCLLLFDVLSGDLFRVVAERVPLWLNLGNKQKPHAARRGRYFDEWVRANAGPPARADRLSPKVFVNRMAKVRVADTRGSAPYSKVSEVLSWETGRPGHSVQQSRSQAGPR